MAFKLVPTYGKQSVPVFKISKTNARHEIIDMVVKIMLEGDVAESWLSGENHQILPTETQKNTCYALALNTDFDCCEDYAVALGKSILSRHKHISNTKVWVRERTWQRIPVAGQEHSHCFMSAAEPVNRTCFVEQSRLSCVVTSGISEIKIMKTTQSGFKGYIEDQYTDLKPVGEGTASPDRIMCTKLEGTWRYSSKPIGGYKTANERIVKILLETFAGPADTGKFSKSLQETAYQMATEVLKQEKSVDNVWLGTPNVHFYTYPLERFGLSNPNIVFQSTDSQSTASGRIETRLARASARL